MNKYCECIVSKPVHKGLCISHVDGKVIFIPKVIPGEKVSVEIIENKKKYSVGRLIEVILPSKSRISNIWVEGDEKKIGGMELSHVAYKDQLKWKTDVLHDCIRRIGGEKVWEQFCMLPPVLVRDVNNFNNNTSISKDNHLHWRTRMIFVCDNDGKLGMSKYHSNNIVHVDNMPLAAQEILDTGILTENNPIKNKISPGDIVYCIVDSLNRVFFRINNNVYDSAGNIYNKKIYQKINVFDLEYEYEIDPSSFWQVHYKAPNILVDCVLKALSGTDFSAYSDFNPLSIKTNSIDDKSIISEKISNKLKGKKILELYSGSGLFTKPIADFIGEKGKVVSVEGNKIATLNAKENLSDYKNFECLKASIDKNFIYKLSEKYGFFDCVLVDPSRSGCGTDVTRSICEKISPEYFIYIACDISSLARDLKVAISCGYKIEQFVCYDLFPHTYHVESVVLMSKAD